MQFSAQVPATGWTNDMTTAKGLCWMTGPASTDDALAVPEPLAVESRLGGSLGRGRQQCRLLTRYLIEIVWKHAKYHWRRFVTWTKETIDAEIAKLLAGYGSEFEIRFA